MLLLILCCDTAFSACTTDAAALATANTDAAANTTAVTLYCYCWWCCHICCAAAFCYYSCFLCFSPCLAYLTLPTRLLVPVLRLLYSYCIDGVDNWLNTLSAQMNTRPLTRVTQHRPFIKRKERWIRYSEWVMNDLKAVQVHTNWTPFSSLIKKLISIAPVSASYEPVLLIVYSPSARYWCTGLSAVTLQHRLYLRPLCLSFF